jgi:phage N-6-adenine-methyltransferase
MITTGLMSSLTDQWATPQALFDELNREFGFTLDACASHWNHKVDNYYDEAQDALVQSWTGVVWMNPPYGRTIKAWMKKAYDSWRGGQLLSVLYQPELIQLGGMIMQPKVRSGLLEAESSLLISPAMQTIQHHSLQR